MIQKFAGFARLLLLGATAVAVGACSRSGHGDDDASTSAPVSAAQSPTPAAVPAESAPLPPELAARLVRFHSPVLGRADAPVTIVEFLDPACEACRAFAPVLKQILFMHPDEVRVVVRYAAFHRGSDEAIRVLEAARRQGKFDDVLTALFDRQPEWAAHGAPNPALAWDIARENGVNLPRAQADGRAASTDALLRQESEDIVALKVERTPTFFVNGRPLTTYGAQPLNDLVAAEIRRTAETPSPP